MSLSKLPRLFTRTSLRAFSSSKSGVNFSLSDEQKEFQSVARKFTREIIIPAASKYDKTGDFPHEIVKQAWELGLNNCHLPKEVGGHGMSYLTSYTILEELTYGCAGITSAINGSELGNLGLKIGGSKDQQKKYFSRMVEEPLMSAFACTEPGAGSDVNGIKATAVKKGEKKENSINF